MMMVVMIITMMRLVNLSLHIKLTTSSENILFKSVLYCIYLLTYLLTY